VEFQHLQWSATTCDFPGAGVYFGLAVPSEHVAVARRMTSKQLRVFVGGAVTLRTDAPPFPFNYFAVRDPSAVKVKPLNRPPLANGFRHVKLAFNFERFYQPANDPEAERAAAAVEDACTRITANQAKATTAAFLITIGLPLAREDRFFDDMIGSRPAQAWEDFYHHMAGQCKDAED
jgi:hypothetical protein